MTKAVEAALRTLVRRGVVERRGKFLWPGRDDFTLQVRRPDPEDENTNRNFEFIPREELELAIKLLIQDALSISEEELIKQVARVFGFDRTGTNIRERVETIVLTMTSRGIVASKEGRISLQEL